MISIDSETNGVDFRHGAKPFFVTVCDEHGNQTWWEWDVDPLTREPQIPDEDIAAINDVISETDYLVAQNAKFDVTALASVGVDGWPWDLTYDTLIAGHLLASNQPHNLTDMAMQYLGADIEPYELAVKEACAEARRVVRRKDFVEEHGEWRIAKQGLSEMPSAKGECWKMDMWLPRAVAARLDYPDDHPWYTVLRDYANADSAVTLPLWKAQREEIERRGLTAIYRERMRVLPVAYRMECQGVTLSKARLDRLVGEYRAESERAGRVCVNIAADYGHELELPRNGVNRSLREFMFGKLQLQEVRNPKAKTDDPTLNKAAMEHYLATLSERSKPLTFVRSLLGKRSRDTALAFMEGYERFWVPLGIFDGRGQQLWYRLYPSLNPTGTGTLRWSSSQPNEQNISKKEGFNLRYCFGPAPGREWWSLDAKNIELRLPAYEAGEQEMVQLFARPDDPPYFGSNHLLISHILHPRLFEACRNVGGQVDGRVFKKRYESTWYKWVKNGNFATQYGAVDKADGTGTADRAYHLPGAQSMIKERFAKMEALNQSCIAFANRHGYIETMPDRSVDPKRGYPLMCTRTEYGKVLETVPLNYHVQGTAMWWMMRAMIRCQAKLDEWRDDDGFDGHIVMQVHDELVFDFPRSDEHPATDTSMFRTSNRWRVRELMELMEQGGDDLGVPTPVSCEYNPEHWGDGETIAW